MDETTAREVVLVQAFETAHPAPPSWSEDDRAWATRAALHDGAGTDAEGFVARRAQHALQRLGPREPAAASWLERRLWRPRWIVWAALLGGVLGLLADSIGASQRINLLAPPLWAVLAWNLAVYALLIGHALLRLLVRRRRSGALVRATERVLRVGRGLPGLGAVNGAAGGSAKALQSFATQWLRLSAPLSALRAATVLHAAAAALALGLIAGMYLRGLVLDYRAGWESTFLSAVNAHAIVETALGPASTLSGIALPDEAGFAALRRAHGAAGQDAPAGPWIHLFALTLMLVVVLPRTLLALYGAVRARWLAAHLRLPLDGAYFQGLARARRGEIAQVFVAPYASTPDAQTGATLRALLAKVLGETAQIEIASTATFGAEDDDAPLRPPAGTTLAVALFDLAATPEAENQGRFARQLAAQAPTILLIDETAFAQRFRADPARLAQRRDAWRVLAVALGTTPVFVQVAAEPDLAGARGIALAMRSPVSAAA